MQSLFSGTLAASELRTGQQTAWMWAMNGAQMLGSIAAMALAFRILGLEGYGQFAIFVAVTTLVSGLVYFPGDEIITTFVTRSLACGNREEAGNILRFALGMALASRWLAYALIGVAVVAFGEWLGIGAEHAAAMLIYALVTVFGAMQNECLAILRLADRVSLGLAAATASALTQVGGLAIAWWMDGGMIMVALAYAACVAVWGGGLLLGAVAAARQKALPLSLLPFSFKVSKEIVNFQLAAFTKSSLRAVNFSLDVVVIAQLTSLSQVGAYRAARQIVDLVQRPFYPLALATQAECSKQWYQGDAGRLRRLALRFGLLSLVLALCGYGLVAGLHPFIIQLVLGSGLAEVAAPLLIMIAGAFVMAATMTLQAVPAAIGRGWPATLAAFGALSVQLVALIALTPTLGASGAAWAYAGYSLATAALMAPFVATALWPRSQRKA